MFAVERIGDGTFLPDGRLLHGLEREATKTRRHEATKKTRRTLRSR
jgi:hypothetical protein